MDDATELRSFLSKDLFDWLQGSDALDACDALLLSKDLFDWLQGSDALDALLLSASEVYHRYNTQFCVLYLWVYENIHTDHTPSLPVPPIPRPPSPTTCTSTHYEYTQASTIYMHWLISFNLEKVAGYRLHALGKLINIHGNMLYLLIRQHEKHCKFLIANYKKKCLSGKRLNIG